ncbi:hypothetical protein M0812_16017 [Anaeramoeba flamelloides]|uniref:Uncharacterized protein n=1 Tax=Anaeramoeba flamelloides TaxID=1746091 RepID=A0AAV7ZGZ4_9EUKA|nr:hypothetical protein M0812_16017 [Anaeramoeba flamelloides]
MANFYPIEQVATTKHEQILTKTLAFKMENDDFNLEFVLFTDCLEISLSNLSQSEIYGSKMVNFNFTEKNILILLEMIKEKPGKFLQSNEKRQEYLLNLGIMEATLKRKQIEQPEQMSMVTKQLKQKVKTLETILLEQRQIFKEKLAHQEKLISNIKKEAKQLLIKKKRFEPQKYIVHPEQWNCIFSKINDQWTAIEDYSQEFQIETESIVDITLQGHYNTGKGRMFLSVKIDDNFLNPPNEKQKKLIWGAVRIQKKEGWGNLSANWSHILPPGKHSVLLIGRANYNCWLNGALMTIIVIPKN